MRELFLHSGDFMKLHFVDAAEAILSFREHKDALIRRTVIHLIPTMASYDTQSFTESVLHKAMSHLLAQLKKPERDLCTRNARFSSHFLIIR